MLHPEPSPSAPRRLRFTLRGLMIGIALLSVVLALAVQLYAIRRRQAELERWGRSLRERERYLHRLGDASRQAVKAREEAQSASGDPRAGASAASEVRADPSRETAP